MWGGIAPTNERCDSVAREDPDDSRRERPIAAGQFLIWDVAPGIPFVRGLATILIATGEFLVAVGVNRFGRNRSRIDGDDFVPANHSVAVAAAAAPATAVLAVIFVWVVRSP